MEKPTGWLLVIFDDARLCEIRSALLDLSLFRLLLLHLTIFGLTTSRRQIPINTSSLSL